MEQWSVVVEQPSSSIVPYTQIPRGTDENGNLYEITQPVVLSLRWPNPTMSFLVPIGFRCTGLSWWPETAKQPEWPNWLLWEYLYTTHGVDTNRPTGVDRRVVDKLLGLEQINGEEFFRTSGLLLYQFLQEAWAYTHRNAWQRMYPHSPITRRK